MHRALKKLLHEARGVSGWVVAIFLDVRGFSSFAKLAESTQAAVFLRSVYLQILDEYFPDAAFFKPTGDGLLVILEFDEEETLKKALNDAVATSFRLVADFRNLCVNDPMINFDVPEDLGIGITRGASTKLVSKTKVLDYSGRPLNLAARLMDLARPRGVVIDESLGVDLLSDDLAEKFIAHDVYIRGIAESDALTVYATEDVQIPAARKRPITPLTWMVDCKETVTLKVLKERGLYLHWLDTRPADPNGIEVALTHPKVTSSGRAHKTMRTLPKFKAQYVEEAGVPRASVDYGLVARKLAEDGVKDSWKIDIELRYLTP